MSFKIHSKESAPKESVEILTQAEKKYGFIPNMLAGLAEAPAVLEGYVTLSKIFEKTSLSSVERQVVLLSVSYENNCTYCMAAHSVIAKMAQVPADVIESIRENKPLEDERLEALRSLALNITVSRGNPESLLLEEFYSVGFTKAQLLEVMLGISVKTLSNYCNHQLQAPLDDSFANAQWHKPA